jgi:hypothetical protein
MASVAGLAPARVGLKIRLRELLCIHGLKLVPEVGIAPTVLADCQVLLFREALICLSYSGVLAHGYHFGRHKLVVPAGNAPAASGYQPGALLLSYRTMVNCGFAPNRFTGRNTSFNRCVGRIRSARFGL